jgi:hypothetical protein
MHGMRGSTNGQQVRHDSTDTWSRCSCPLMVSFGDPARCSNFAVRDERTVSPSRRGLVARRSCLVCTWSSRCEIRSLRSSREHWRASPAVRTSSRFESRSQWSTGSHRIAPSSADSRAASVIRIRVRYVARARGTHLTPDHRQRCEIEPSAPDLTPSDDDRSIGAHRCRLARLQFSQGAQGSSPPTAPPQLTAADPTTSGRQAERHSDCYHGPLCAGRRKKNRQTGLRAHGQRWDCVAMTEPAILHGAGCSVLKDGGACHSWTPKHHELKSRACTAVLTIARLWCLLLGPVSVSLSSFHPSTLSRHE